MKEEDLRAAAKQLRRLADEIESGEWGSVDVVVENDFEDKPRTWRDGAKYRGVDLLGRTATVRLGMPSKKMKEG